LDEKSAWREAIPRVPNRARRGLARPFLALTRKANDAACERPSFSSESKPRTFRLAPSKAEQVELWVAPDSSRGSRP